MAVKDMDRKQVLVTGRVGVQLTKQKTAFTVCTSLHRLKVFGGDFLRLHVCTYYLRSHLACTVPFKAVPGFWDQVHAEVFILMTSLEEMMVKL